MCSVWSNFLILITADPTARVKKECKGYVKAGVDSSFVLSSAARSFIIDEEAG